MDVVALGELLIDFTENGVSGQGNPLFEDIFVEKFKNRSDGTITVVMTPSAGSYARDVEKVARIWFFVQRYEVQEGQRVSIPLEQHSELSN